MKTESLREVAKRHNCSVRLAALEVDRIATKRPPFRRAVIKSQPIPERLAKKAAAFCDRKRKQDVAGFYSLARPRCSRFVGRPILP